MGDRRVFRIAANERVIRALVEAAQGKGEAWFLACTASADRTALLDEAIGKLPELAPRLVRIRDPRPAQLGLDGFVAQALGRQGAEAPSEDDLVAVFERLVGGHGANRTVLVVDGAEQMSLQAIRYIQLACRSAPELQIIFAGAHAFRDLLAHDEFAHLRRRLRPDIVVPCLSDEDVALAIQQSPAVSSGVLPGAVETSAPALEAAELPAPSALVLANAPRHRSRRTTVALAAMAAVAAGVAVATLPVAQPWAFRVAVLLPSVNTTEAVASGALQPVARLPEASQGRAERAMPELETAIAAPTPDPTPLVTPPLLRVAEAGSAEATPVSAPEQSAEAPSAPPKAALPVMVVLEQRPTPAPAATLAQAAAPVSVAQDDVGMTPALADALLARGNAMLAVGDISAARLLFEHAAAGGSAAAMEAAGRAYDPEFLAQIGVTRIRADAGLAAAYYRKAAALGGTGHPEPRRMLQAQAAAR